MDDQAARIKIHFRYWVCILTVIIIAIATDRWSAQKDFTAYLSNAATLTSLVLGLVAIFYSFISNDTLSQGLGNISTVATTVNETKGEISKYLELTRYATTATQTNIASMIALSGDVTTHLGTLNEALRNIGEQTTSLHDVVGLLPVRLDQLERNVLDNTKLLGTKDKDAAQSINENGLSVETVMYFLRTSAVLINILTYACVLAARSGKSISLEDIGSIIGMDGGYLYGSLNCMHSVQLMSVERSDDWHTSKIIDVDRTLATQTEKYLYEYLNRKRDSDVKKYDAFLAMAEQVKAKYS